MTAWDDQDLRALHQIGAGLGSFQVITIEENPMTDQAPEQDYDGEPEQSEGVSFPELPDNPHNHRFTISVDGRGPMIVVRGNTARETREAFEELVNGGVAAAAQAAYQAFKNAPAPQAMPQGGPFGQPTPPPFGPNVSVPQAPGYQGPPAPQAPAWGGQPQAPAQQWGGGGQQAQGERKQYPAPQGWYKLNVPFPGGTDQLHAAAAAAGIPKGQPGKGGMYNFWGLTPGGQPGKAWYCAPQVAQAFAQFTPMPA